ncbi:MAG: hypothetical protein K6G19_01620 [Lachnospiraceae bacterium]|nr:hypothetical protein [Lachnospiraceae bacterium]
MAVMDEFQEERDKIKDASFKAKWKYFKDYYLMWVIVAVVILAIAVPILVSMFTHKKDALYVCMINFVENDSAQSDIKDRFTAVSGINQGKERIVIDTSMFIAVQPEVSADEASAVSGNDGEYSVMDTIKYGYEDQQKLSAILFTGSVDIIITGEDVFQSFAAMDYFVPLDEIYSEEELKAYADADMLLYRDGTAVGIYVDDMPGMKNNYVYDGEGNPRIAAGYIVNSAHVELASEFIDFLEGK